MSPKHFSVLQKGDKNATVSKETIHSSTFKNIDTSVMLKLVNTQETGNTSSQATNGNKYMYSIMLQPKILINICETSSKAVTNF